MDKTKIEKAIIKEVITAFENGQNVPEMMKEIEAILSDISVKHVTGLRLGSKGRLVKAWHGSA